MSSKTKLRMQKSLNAREDIRKKIADVERILPKAKSVSEHAQAINHLNNLREYGNRLIGFERSQERYPGQSGASEADSNAKFDQIYQKIQDELQALEQLPFIKEAIQSAPTEAAPDEVKPIRARAAPAKPIASLEARRNLASAAKRVADDLEAMIRTLGSKEATIGSTKDEPASTAIKGEAKAATAQYGQWVKPTAPPAEPHEARQRLKDEAERANEAIEKLRKAVKDTSEPAKPVARYASTTPAPKAQQIVIEGPAKPRHAATYIPAQKLAAPGGEIKYPEPPKAIVFPELEAKPAPEAKPVPEAKAAPEAKSIPAAPAEDAFSALRRELNKSEPNAVTIRNILNGFGNLDNTNLDLLERDPNLINSLAALKNAITIGADDRVTLHEKFIAKVNDARIHLEQDLMQPIRDTVASLQNDSAPRDLQVQINRALDYSTGLPLYSDLRRPLEELRNKIQESDAINAETVKNDFAKTVTTHMVGRLRNLLARSQEPDHTELEYMIKQLSAPITGLANTHSLLHKTALPNTLHQLERVKNAGTDLERSDAQAALTLAIKNLRHEVTQPERVNRNAAIEKQIREMDPNDKARIIANVGNHLDRYTNIALFSNQAQMNRRAKARDELLPVMEQKLEDIKLHLEVYRQYIQNNIDEHKKTRPLTDNIRTQLDDLSKAANEKMSYEVFPVLISRMLAAIGREHPVYNQLADVKNKLDAIYVDDVLKSDGRLSNAALSEFRDELSRILSETKTLLANDDNWLTEDRAMREQHNKVNASIESLDKILEQGDRAFVKPMKLKILADRNEVVSKDHLQATIDRFNGNMPVIAPPPRMEQGGAGKSRAFSSSEALVTTTSITTGFGPTKKASEFMSVISNENGVHTAQLYFHEKEMKSSLFGGKDGYTKGGAKTMHDFLATSPAPYKPIHLSAGAPKEFVKEILTYCKLKNIKISVDASYKMSLSDISKSDVKSLQDRLKKLFHDDPNMAVDVNKEAVVQQQISTGVRVKR